MLMNIKQRLDRLSRLAEKQQPSQPRALVVLPANNHEGPGTRQPWLQIVEPEPDDKPEGPEGDRVP